MQAFIAEFIAPLDEIQNQIEEWERNLSKNVNNLDDIAFVMETLADIRLKEIKQDMTLMQCEVSWTYLIGFLQVISFVC